MNLTTPTQINYQIPPGTVNGTATITITSGDGTISTGTLQIATVAPGLFTTNTFGTGAPAAIAVHAKLDGSQPSELMGNPDGTTTDWTHLRIFRLKNAAAAEALAAGLDAATARVVPDEARRRANSERSAGLRDLVRREGWNELR